MNRKLISILTVTLLINSHAWSDGKVWDFDEITGRALQNNAELTFVTLEIQKAEAENKGVGKWDNPDLELGYSDDRIFKDEGIQSIALGISQRFPLASRLQKLKKISLTDIELAKMELAQKRNEVAFLIRKIILEIQALQTQIELRERMASLDAELISFTQSLYERGEASQLDVNQANLELSALQQGLKRMQIRKLDYFAQLKQAMGVRHSEAIKIDETLPLLLEYNQGGENQWEQILERKTGYVRAKLLERRAVERFDYEKAARWGDLETGIHYEQDKDIGHTGTLEKDQVFGISVSFPIPVWNQNQSAVEQSQIEIAQATTEQQRIRMNLEIELETILAEVDSLAAIVGKYQNEVLIRSEENLVMIRQAYRNGQMSLMNLLQAQESHLHLENEFIESVKDYHLTVEKLRFARAEGIYNPFKNE
jgi:cobalt-zinc-cadmium efflux system outer membrane protein